MLTGSCSTSAFSAPSDIPLSSVSDASKPTNRTLPAHPLPSSTRSIASVVDSLGVKMPSTSSCPSARFRPLRSASLRFVERREHDARHAARHEAFDFGDLRIALILAQRSAPDDRDAELLCGLRRAGVNALPEDVGGPFRDDGDRERSGLIWS